MTAAACGLAGGACSDLLGLDDPKPDLPDGGDIPDGPPGGDGPSGADRVEVSLGSFQIMKGQRVRIRATAFFPGGAMEDVTATATYSSDNRAIADVTIPGNIDGGSQPGMAMISVGLGGARAATVAVMVRDEQCQPVINELQAGGMASADDEWVEILNPCTTAITVQDWTLVYRAATTTGATDSTLLATLTGQIPAGEFRLFAGPAFPSGGATPDGRWNTGALGGTNGAVGLRNGPKDSVGTLVDSVAYGAVTTSPVVHPFIEMAAIPAMMNGRPAQRLPFDGRDDDNGPADFMAVTTGSPRAANVP